MASHQPKSAVGLVSCLFLITMLAFFSSCSERDENIVYDAEQVKLLKINVQTLSPGEAENEKEIISSLRVILVNSDSRVCENVSVSKNSESIEDFSEDFEFKVTPGDYNIYVIANEESVKDYNIEGEDGVVRESLGARLANYAPGNSGFEDFIKGLYFRPDYSAPLPYSAVYTISIADEDATQTVYIVPVATKLEINFQNYRNDLVIFKEIILDKVADHNYLMAKIPEEYQYFEDKYWIDWLKEVADDTNLHPELSEKEDSNDLINQKWGWLRNYFMPEATTHEGVNIIEPGKVLEVPRSSVQAGDKPIPGEKKLECIYFPESKNTDGGPEQNYGLTFKIQLNAGEIKEIQADLGYVETLFRNTHVRVNVELYAGSEEVYAQIVRWKETGYSYGQIQPE